MTIITGCTSNPRWDPADFFVAVRYDIHDSKEFSKKHTEWERGIDLQYDFGRIADLGFNTVFVKTASNANIKTALDAAATQKIEVALALQVDEKPGPDPRSRKSGNGYPYAPISASLTRHKSFRAAIVESGCDSPGACRAVDICSSVSKAGLRCIPLFGAAYLAESGTHTKCNKAQEITARAPAVVDTANIAEKDFRSPKQLLLAQFHAALSANQTGGLVVSGWQHKDSAEYGRFDSLPAPRAAVTALIHRAKSWGPRLVGATVVKEKATVSCAPYFRVTTFARGDRRHILVFNPAPDRHARGELRIPTSFAGRNIEKAVQVPDQTSSEVGEVHYATGGAILVPLVLPPGEAVLLEVF